MSRSIRTFVIASAALALVGFTAPTPAVETSTDAEAALEDLAPEKRHGQISRRVTEIVKRNHYQRIKVDDRLSEEIFDRYLEVLDGNRMYLYAADVTEFARYRHELDDAVADGQLDPAFEIFFLYRERTRERTEAALLLLETEPDYTVEEQYVFDRKDLPWPEDKTEMDEIWRKKVKNDALSLILAGKTWEEATELLEKRYSRVLKRVAQINSEDVFETFMNAYSNTLDPHSTYLSPRNSEEYRIQMSLSYDGIGASLQVDDEYVTVVNIIAGGPAAIDGELKPKDRIVGVGQGPEGEVVDVVGWRLDDVVQLIRGPRNTVVRLLVLPAGAPPGSPERVLPLERNQIKLEAQAAKKEVLNIERDQQEWTIGVITVPSFYQDYTARSAGDKDYRSTHRDVARLIEELSGEGMDGLVIDLRGNGGGHLSEARDLTGLFIDQGPIVQLRTFGGTVEVLPDEIPAAVYDGPLAVLVDRYSASASEIFAAAIQDYGRGIVVGQQTFGKGSVQNLYVLDRLLPGQNPGYGQLTLTIGKYYRVTGDSTQHRGVEPDIPLPSVVDASEVGESTRKSALPWDRIQAIEFRREKMLDPAIGTLSEIHSARAADDPDFNHLLSDIEAFADVRSRQSVSLVLAEREAERERLQAERLARENERRAAHGLDPLESFEALEEEEPVDVVLLETAQIVADLAGLDNVEQLEVTVQSKTD